jgi:hypothetical protein
VSAPPPGRIVLLSGEAAPPAPPLEFSEVVELYARGQGRHARLEWDRDMGCWSVLFTLPADNTLHRMVRAGDLAPTEAVERVHLHFWTWDDEAHTRGHLEPIRLDDYGPGGLVELLAKGLIGDRGEYPSFQAYVSGVAAENRARRARWFEAQAERTREKAAARRRRTFGLPLITVPSTFNLTSP